MVRRREKPNKREHISKRKNNLRRGSFSSSNSEKNKKTIFTRTPPLLNNNVGVDRGTQIGRAGGGYLFFFLILFASNV